MRVSNKNIGVGAAFSATLCWGVAIVMSKGALNDFSPITLLVFQLLSSVIFLWCVVCSRRRARPGLSDVAKFSWLGLLEPFLTYLLVLTGMTYSGASEASVLQSLESIMIVLIAALLFREYPSREFVFYSVLVLLGISIVLGVESHFIHKEWLGTALITLGMLAAAFYVVLSSRIAEKYDVFYIVASQQTLALIVALFILPFEWRGFTVSSITWGAWSLALLSGVIQYALAFVFYMVALRHISAGLAGVYLNFVPLVGIAGAFIFLDEKLSLLQLGGALLVVIALVLISVSAQAKATTYQNLDELVEKDI